MKNKFDGYCYVCALYVEEEKGIAERIKRHPGDPGWGETVWAVRHPNCIPPKEPDTEEAYRDYTKNFNQHHHAN